MDPFIGEIRLMGFGITPKGWLPCNGQLLPVNQNQALYAVLGTTYGGDGVSTFSLPDLRGRVPVGMGQGQGLSNYPIGQRGGTEGVVLSQAQMPAHTHPVSATLQAASAPDSNSPAGTYPALPDDGSSPFNTGSPNATMSNGLITGATTSNGASQGHENRQPVIALNYCIAITGIFPTRS